MSDYGAMQSRIADEIARSDLTNQVKLAIQSAIDFHERERFYFNEDTTTWSTVANQEYYGSADNAEIPNLVEIDALKINANGRTYPLLPRDFAYMDAVSSTTTHTGDPVDYCYFRQRFRFYPIPSATRTVTLAYVKRLSTLSISADTNAWMTDGEELVRARAKWNLFLNVIRNPEEAAFMKAIEREALSALRAETTRRISVGRIRPAGI
ncbi:MAG: phage adaptor protein [Alphaproteobacteria bacterium]